METVTNAAIAVDYNVEAITLISAAMGALGVLLGAIITIIFTHFSSKNRMKRDLEINACELIINRLSTLFSIIHATHLNLQKIHCRLEYYGNNIDATSDLAVVYRDLIKERIDTHKEKVELFDNTIQDLIIAYESKAVILHDLNSIYTNVKDDLLNCNAGMATLFRTKIIVSML